MPTPKRWFPVARELNDDGEVWALTIEFGDRTLRLWLEALSILDRCDNTWRLNGDWVGTLARKVRLSRTTVSAVISWMIAKKWLVVEEAAENGSPLILNSPNFWKYHKRREASGTKSVPHPAPSYPNHPNQPKPIRPNPTRPKVSDISINGNREDDLTHINSGDSLLVTELKGQWDHIEKVIKGME